jgi:DNA polymerase III gamma/tau subunit
VKQVPANVDSRVPALFDQLTPREQAFVMHPDVFTNPIKAAMDVGYSESTAKGKSHIMRHQLMYYIMPIHEARVAETGVTIERVKNELSAIAFANEADYYDTIDIETETGAETVKVVKDISRLPEHMQRAIKHIEFKTIILGDSKTYQVLEHIELYDKQSALKELAEILGAHDPRFRKPETPPGEEEMTLLEHLEPEELELVTRAYDKAAQRARAASDRKRDARAIPGEVVKSGDKKKK